MYNRPYGAYSRCHAFGKGYDDNDDECADCADNVECYERAVNGRARPVAKRPRPNSPSTSYYRPPTRRTPPAPRHDGEPWWARWLKNVVMGMMERLCDESADVCSSIRPEPVGDWAKRGETKHADPPEPEPPAEEEDDDY